MAAVVDVHTYVTAPIPSTDTFIKKIKVSYIKSLKKKIQNGLFNPEPNSLYGLKIAGKLSATDGSLKKLLALFF